MNPTIEQLVILTAAIFGGGVFGTLGKEFLTRRRTDSEAVRNVAESRDLITQATERVVGLLDVQLRAALKRATELEQEVEALRRDIYELRQELYHARRSRRHDDFIPDTGERRRDDD